MRKVSNSLRHTSTWIRSDGTKDPEKSDSASSSKSKEAKSSEGKQNLSENAFEAKQSQEKDKANQPLERSITQETPRDLKNTNSRLKAKEAEKLREKKLERDKKEKEKEKNKEAPEASTLSEEEMKAIQEGARKQSKKKGLPRVGLFDENSTPDDESDGFDSNQGDEK